MITVGCGDDATPTSGGTGVTPTAAGGTPGTDAPPSGGSTNLAVIQIGDNRYEADVTPGAIQRCDPNFFGSFWVIGYIGDDVGATLEMLLSPDDLDEELGMDEPYVRVGDPEGGYDWQADPEFAATNDLPTGASQVDSFEVVGNRVTGTATFVDANAVYGGGEVESVPGTFEVVCSGD
jgi:hypothetical protein